MTVLNPDADGVQTVRMHDQLRIVMSGVTIDEVRRGGGAPEKQVEVSFSIQDTGRKSKEVARLVETVRSPGRLDLNDVADCAAGKLACRLRNLADSLAPAG